jgi:hypothetical protein
VPTEKGGHFSFEGRIGQHGDLDPMEGLLGFMHQGIALIVDVRRRVSVFDLARIHHKEGVLLVMELPPSIIVLFIQVQDRRPPRVWNSNMVASVNSCGGVDEGDEAVPLRCKDNWEIMNRRH